MSTTRVTVDPDDPKTFPKGKIDFAVVDATTDEQIALQQREDDEEAMNEGAAARRGRRLTDPETRKPTPKRGPRKEGKKI